MSVFCSHIDWHLEAGLAVVFAEAPTEFRGDGPKSGIITPQYLDLCPAYNALPAGQSSLLPPLLDCAADPTSDMQ